MMLKGKNCHILKLATLAIIFLSFFNHAPLSATAKSWDPTSTNTNSSTNWSPNGVPGAGDDVTIPTNTYTPTTPNFFGFISNALIFSSSGSALILNNSDSEIYGNVSNTTSNPVTITLNANTPFPTSTPQIECFLKTESSLANVGTVNYNLTGIVEHVGDVFIQIVGGGQRDSGVANITMTNGSNTLYTNYVPVTLTGLSSDHPSDNIELFAPLTILNPNPATIAAYISGSNLTTSSLTYNSASVLSLTNTSNNYSGGTTLTGGGTLQIPKTQAIGTGTLHVTGGKLKWTGNDTTPVRTSASSTVVTGIASTNFFDTNGFDVKINDTISGTGGFTKIGAGILSVSNTLNTYTLDTIVKEGTLQVPSLNAIGTAAANVLTLESATLQWSASNPETRTSANSIVLTGDSTTNFLDTNGFTGIIHDTISGTGFTKIGAGILSLNTQNTYTSNTIVNAGTLQVPSLDVIGTQHTNVLTLNSATLQWSASQAETRTNANIIILLGDSTTNFLDTNGFTGIINDHIVGTGFTKIGAGTLLLTNSLNDYSGATNVNVGTLAFTNTTSTYYSGNVNLASSTTLQVPDLSAIGTGILNLDRATVKWTGPDAGTRLSTNSMTFAGGTTPTNTIDTNSYHVTINDLLSNGTTPGGFTKINAGILTLTNPLNDYSGDTDVNAGTLTFTNSQNDYTGNINVNASTLIFTNPSNSYAGDVSISAVSTLQTPVLGAIGTGILKINDSTVQWTTDDIGTRTSANSITLTGIATSNFLDTNSHDVTINDLISGLGGFTKTGTGTLTLTNLHNTYLGDTDVNDGTLAFTNTSNTYSGNVNLASGTILEISTLDSIGTGILTMNSATVEWTGTNAETLRTSSNSMKISGIATANTLNSNSHNITINDIISDGTGPGRLTMTGGGIFTLEGGPNTYTLGTIVNSTTTLNLPTLAYLGTGSLSLNDATINWTNTDVGVALTGSNSMTLTGAASLNTLNTNSHPVTIQRLITGSGGFTQTGTGTLTLTHTPNTYSGDTIVNNGSLAFPSLNAVGTGVLRLNEATIQWTGADAGTRLSSNSITLTGIASTNTLNTNGHNVTINDLISGLGGFTKTGTGILTLTKTPNTYVGGTIVNSGTLAFPSLNALGTGVLALNEATVQWTSTDAGTRLSSNSITLTGIASINTLDTNGHDVTINDLIIGLGGFTKTGTGILTLNNNSNSYREGTTLNQGTIQFAHDTALGSPQSVLTINGGTVQWTANDNTTTRQMNIINSGGTLSLQGNQITLNNQMAGNGPLIVTTSIANRLILTNNNGSYTGLLSLPANFVLQGLNNGASIPNANMTTIAASTTLEFSQGLNGPATYRGVLSGPGNMLIDTGTTVLLTGISTYTGGTTVTDNGTVVVSSDSNLGNSIGSLSLNNGTLQTSASTHYRTIALTGTNNGVNTGPSNVIFYSPIINGTSNGGFTKTGSGTMILAGTSNTYTGGTTIAASGGTISGSSDNFPVDAVITINGSVSSAGTLNFTQTTDGTFSGTLLGTGNITTARSTHRLTLNTNNSAFAGTTYIPEGILKIASSGSLGGNINLNGGMITGTGTLSTFGSGTVTVSSGTIHPGNSPGILNILGNYNQTGGILAIDINGEGNTAGIHCSTLDVGGAAQLERNGYVFVTSEDGTFFVEGVYPIIQTDLGVNGKLSDEVIAINGLNGQPLLVNPILNYDAFNVYLDFKTPIFGLLNNENELNVLEQLFSITSRTPEQQVLLNALLSSDVNGFLLGLNELSGSQYSQLLSLTELSTSQFIQRLYDPLRSILAYYPSRAFPNCFEPSYNFWITGSGGIDRVNNNHGEYGFKTNKYALTSGFNLNLSPCLTLGLSGSYERSETHFNIGGSNQGKTILGGLYFALSHRNYYVFGDLVGGSTSNALKRHFTIGSTTYSERGQPNSFQGAAYLESGANFLYDSSIIIQPFIGLEFGFYQFKKFAEVGDNVVGLHLKSRSYGSTSSRLGVHFSTLQLPCGLYFGLDLSWKCLWDDFQHTRSMHFKKFGTDFEIKGSDMSSNSFNGSFNVTQTFDNSWSIFATGNLTMRQYETAYDLIGGVSFDW